MASDAEQRELDWLNKLRLRIKMLPHNPYFQAAMRGVRESLAIPQDGFGNPEDATAKLHWE